MYCYLRFEVNSRSIVIIRNDVCTMDIEHDDKSILVWEYSCEEDEFIETWNI